MEDFFTANLILKCMYVVAMYTHVRFTKFCMGGWEGAKFVAWKICG